MVLGLPKPHFLRAIFDHFLGPVPDPPLEGLFAPSWHARVPTYTQKVDFGPLLGPRRSPVEMSFSRSGGPGTALGAPWSCPARQKGPWSDSLCLQTTVSMDLGLQGYIFNDFNKILDVISTIVDGCWAAFGARAHLPVRHITLLKSSFVFFLQDNPTIR